TCRTCLANINGITSVPIFTETCNATPEIILNEFSFLKLKLARDDGLPQQICNNCLTNLLNVREFRKICFRSQDVLEKFFKISTQSDSFAIEPSKSIAFPIADLNEQNFSDFEFLNIDNVEYDAKIEVVGVDGSIISAEDIEYIDNQNDQNETIGNTVENIDDDSSPKSIDSTHDDSESFECNICGKLYKRKAHLLRHLISHKSESGSDGNMYKKRNLICVCNKCGKRFSKSKGLENHEIEGTCVKEENPQCRFCKETFTNVSNLEDHLAQIHPVDRPHLCPICKKTFQSVSNRNTHLQSHNKGDTYKCSDCGQGFKSKVYLNKHKKSVHAVNEHDCPHCSMKFFNTTKFEYHLKSHEENKKYKCKYCSKSFLQHHHLANHERIHTNVRPFLCSICGKGKNSIKRTFVMHTIDTLS
ncbi:Zinc finger protein, partial [Pseudolycoriella hygida]